MATKKKAKKKAPSYADSTYNKQISYYNKLLADFNAQQTRSTNDASTYYGTQSTPDKKENVKDKKGKQVYDTKKVRTGFNYFYKVMPNGKKTKQQGSAIYKTVKTARTKTTKGKAATQGLYQKELGTNRGKDLTDIADDYAARGMIHSGLYAQKRGDYETEYGKQLAETNRQKTKQYGDLSAERTQFTREQELQKEQAKLEAIRRRAAMSGNLGL